MKILSMLRLKLSCLVIFFTIILQSIAFGSQSLPAEAFSALPKISYVRISPDGTHLLFLLNIESQTMLACQNIETGEWRGIAKTDNKEFKFRKIYWANNDTILFSAAFPYRRNLAVPTTETRIFTAKSDGSEKYKVLVKPRIPAKSKSDHNPSSRAEKWQKI